MVNIFFSIYLFPHILAYLWYCRINKKINEDLAAAAGGGQISQCLLKLCIQKTIEMFSIIVCLFYGAIC